MPRALPARAVRAALCLAILGACRSQTPPPAPTSRDYADLTKLFAEWRAFQQPKRVDGVPDSVKEAADGMGYTSWRRFLAVDVRLATPTIIAGVRIATVTTIGLVTVTALIGQGGYGALINDGLSRNGTWVNGRRITGLVAPQSDGSLVVLQSNGQKATIASGDVEQTLPSKVSAMPEGLMNSLTLEEIANLFAFLNTPPHASLTSRRPEPVVGRK